VAVLCSLGIDWSVVAGVEGRLLASLGALRHLAQHSKHASLTAAAVVEESRQGRQMSYSID